MSEISESKPRIDIKAAVNAARSYLMSVQHIMGEQLKNLRFEEVELSEDKMFWLITLGFDVDVITNNPLEVITPIMPKQERRREYKLFKVNSQTGEVEAMKIRKI